MTHPKNTRLLGNRLISPERGRACLVVELEKEINFAKKLSLCLGRVAAAVG